VDIEMPNKEIAKRMNYSLAKVERMKKELRETGTIIPSLDKMQQARNKRE
jgi:transposase